MTPDEVNLFNYIYNTQGKDAAYEYYDFLRSDLYRRNRAADEAYFENRAREAPFASSVYSVVSGPMKGVSYLMQAADYLSDGEIDQNAPYNKFAYIPTAIRGEVSKTIEESGKWGEAGSFFYNTGMSMADFLFNAAITGGLSGGGAMSSNLALAIMGTGAAADTVISLKDQGIDDNRAFTLGTIAGAAEVITEKISLEALLKPDMTKGAMRYIVKNMLAEGSEEGLSDIINWVADDLYDLITSQDQSEWKRTVAGYIEDGMTESEAFGKAIGERAKELGLDVLGGVISGGVMSTAGAGINTAKDYKTGSNLDSAGFTDLQGMLDVALSYPQGTPANKLAGQVQQKLFGDKAIGKREIGALYNSVEQAAEDDAGGFSLLLSAVEQVSTGKKVSNKMASEILDNAYTMELLTQSYGLELNDTMTQSQRREAVKDSIMALASPAEATVESPAKVDTPVAQNVTETLTAPTQESEAEAVRDFASTLDKAGGGAFVSMYNKGQNSAGYIKGAMAVYNAGKQGAPLESVSGGILTAEQRDAIYIAGQADAQRGAESVLPPVAIQGTIQDRQGYTDTQLKEGITYGRTGETEETGDSLLRQGGERVLSQRGGGQDGRISEGTAAVRAGWNAHGEPKDSQRASLAFEEKVDPRSFLREAKAGQTVYRDVSKTKAVKDSHALAAKNGMRLTAWGGSEIEIWNGVSIRGWAIMGTDEIGVQTDNPEVASDDLTRHELMEQKLGRGEVSVDEVLDGAKRYVDAAKLQIAINFYVKSYPSESIEHARSELVCDGADHINQLRYDVEHGKLGGAFAELADTLDEVLDAVNRTANELTGGAFELDGQTEYADAQGGDALDLGLTGPAGEARFSYNALANAAGFEAREADGRRWMERKGNHVTTVTEQDVRRSPIGAVITASIKSDDFPAGITKAEADIQVKYFADILTKCATMNDFAMGMQFAGSAAFTALKLNSDKQYGATYDFPSICTKTQAIIDAMSAKMVSLQRGLSHAEIIELYEEIFEIKNPVPCPECYVFARWIGIGGLLDNMHRYQKRFGNLSESEVYRNYYAMQETILKFARDNGLTFGKGRGKLARNFRKKYNDLLESIEKAKNQGEDVNRNDLKKLKLLETELDTVDSMTWLENVYYGGHPAARTRNEKAFVPTDVLFDLNRGNDFCLEYPEAWAFRTTQGAGYGKAITPYADAVLGEGIMTTGNKGFIKKKQEFAQRTGGEFISNPFLEAKDGILDDKAKVALKKARENLRVQSFKGGQRFSSTSDAKAENFSDFLLATLEVQAMGGMVQVYTKVAGAVKVYDDWGYSTNMSLMPKRNGIDENGNLADTAVGGMNPATAAKLREETVGAGTITIGVNDRQIFLMQEDRVRDFIIPYHASGGKGDTVGKLRRIQEGEKVTAQEDKKKTVPERSTDYSRLQNEKFMSDALLRNLGRADEIDLIHARREARIAIMTGKRNINMSVVRGSRFLSALYDMFNGGEWDGVKLTKADAEYMIYPNEYWDKTVDYEHSGKITEDYLAYCNELGVLHKFSGRVITNRATLAPLNGYDDTGKRVPLKDHAYEPDANGQPTDTIRPYFWKELVDRRMYGNDGKYLPQRYVRLTTTKANAAESFAKTIDGSREYDPEKSKAFVEKIRQLQEKGVTKHSQKASVRDGNDSESPVSQEISSAKTSIKQVPALFKDPNVSFGNTNIDIGGGRFNLATDYLASIGTKNMVFDPYNRSEDVNSGTLDFLRDGRRADTATCANVLNVIKEADARANVILETAKSIKPDGKAYFMVYEGDGSSVGKQTTAGWQNNRKTHDYMDEIRKYFRGVKRQGKLITATEPKGNLPKASWEVSPGKGIRYSQKAKAYNETVVLNESTVEKYLKDYAAPSSPKYAQAYITSMRPSDFLSLTTSVSGESKIRSETQALNTEDMGAFNLEQPIYLKIDHATGEVLGHEGRHRMMALENAGVRSVPVLLFDSGNKYSKTPVETVRLKGQFEGSRTVSAKDLEPLSYDNRARVVERFTKQPGYERYAEKSGLAETVRFSRKTGEALSEADVERILHGHLEDYGAISPGETPARTVQVPKRTSEKDKVSQTVRTVLEAKATPDATVPNIKELIARGEYSYEAYSDKQAIADAESIAEDVGWDAAQTKWFKDVESGKVSKEITAMGWTLYNNAANSDNTALALDILDAMVRHQRSAAQAVQATRILKQLDPQTRLYGVTRSVKNLQRDLEEKYGDKAPGLQIDEELAAAFIAAKTAKAREDALADIYRDIGRQMPSRFIDKWNAWRYLAMLANPRTHIRNIVGNAAFAPVVGVKNLIATGIEAVVDKVSPKGIDRTKSLAGVGGALYRAALADYENVAEVALGGGKYNDAARGNKYIEEGRTIFKTKAIEWARKANSKALDVEDVWFSKPHYAAAMAQFCKANGITPEQIASGKGIERAREYAIKEAQKATYRDTNALSQAMSEMGRYEGKNPVKQGMSKVMEGILPFRKTPANILARGIEYSPIGLLKSLTTDLAQVKNGTKTAAEAIDGISAGLTGTGLLMLGLYLAAMGLVRGFGGSDDKKDEFEELQGHQDYALELPDGTSITLDWLAPACLPFFIGVNLYETTNGGEKAIDMAGILEAVQNISDPLMEMSCLQSLNDVFDAVGYASSGGLDALPAVVASAATSYLTQGIPTLLGQLERTAQSSRMTTYTSKNRFLTRDMQYALGKSSARIPGWDYSQIPYIDAWGREETTGNIVGRAFGNMMNPSYTSRVESNAMEQELERLYDATGEGSVFPQRAVKSFKAGDEDKELTAEEYVEYATAKGQISYEMMNDLVESATYKNASDSEKVALIENIYNYANQVAKGMVSDFKPEGWVAEAQTAQEQYAIPAQQYIAVKQQVGDITSLKNINGDTIPNSKGLLVMEAIYEIRGLTDAQRLYLFQCFDVGKTVIHYNKALVEEKLEEMRNQ